MKICCPFRNYIHFSIMLTINLSIFWAHVYPLNMIAAICFPSPTQQIPFHFAIFDFKLNCCGESPQFGFQPSMYYGIFSLKIAQIVIQNCQVDAETDFCRSNIRVAVKNSKQFRRIAFDPEMFTSQTHTALHNSATRVA